MLLLELTNDVIFSGRTVVEISVVVEIPVVVDSVEVLTVFIPKLLRFPFNDKSPLAITVSENVGLDRGAYVVSICVLL